MRVRTPVGQEEGWDLASCRGEGWKSFEFCSPFFGRRVDDGRHGSVCCVQCLVDAGGTESAGEEEEGKRENRKAEEEDYGGSQGGNQDERGLSAAECGCPADVNEQRDRRTALERAQGRLPSCCFDAASAVPDGSSSPRR